MPNVAMSLHRLPAGQPARCQSLTGPDSATQRLGELGLIEGAELTLLKAGNPCIVMLGRSRLSLRLPPSVEILVEPIEAAQ